MLSEAAELEGVDEVFPVSARTGAGLDELVARLAELMPEGPYLYPPEERSDQPSELLLAELIREQVLNRTREEVPHSVEVSVTEVSARDDGLVTVRAEVWAESESQKGILIGAGGAQGRRDRHRRPARARAELGARVHLDLQVKVRRHWRRDTRCSTASASSRPRRARPYNCPHVEGVGFDDDGLVPCVAQDHATGEVLTLAYMSEESLRLTVETGEVHYFSRSRDEIWHKGRAPGTSSGCAASATTATATRSSPWSSRGAGLPHR